ncbi:hypothetical protein AA313_de0208748 [Arthrobotrys entomopaga]|nr:hypothetical protein AA313_de0208748 [Arthrobotrys entomopaga]
MLDLGQRIGTNKLITKWSIYDVVDFMKSLRLFQYSRIWIENEIDGDALVHLVHEDLQDMGINSVGHRLRILKSVYNIKVSQKIPFEEDHFVPPGAHRPSTNEEASILVTVSELQDTVSAIQQRDKKINDLEYSIKRLKDEMGPLFDMLKDRFQLEGLASFEMELMPEMPCIMDIQTPPIPPSLLMKALPEIPSGDLGSWAEDALMDIGRSAGKDSHSKGRKDSKSKQRNSKRKDSKRRDSKQRDSKQSINSAGSRGSSGSNPNRHFHLPELKLSRVSIGPNGIVSPDGTIVYDTPLRREFEELERLFGNSDDSDNRRDTWPPNPGNSTDSDGYDGDESRDESPVIKSPMIRMMQDQTPGLTEKTYQVLPAALKQYGIEADWWDYELWVTFNGGERMFDDDERPLEIFKRMAKDGMEPMLKLRKKLLDPPARDGDSH